MNMRKKGDRGEAQAAAYLEKAGCTILAKNHCIRGGEVDIIFSQDGVNVFCEVKLRTQQLFGTGAEAVNTIKQRHICKAALDWACKNECADSLMRFDVIEINGGQIRHIKNAFEYLEE